MTRHSGHPAKRQRLIAVLDVGTSKICCLIARAETTLRHRFSEARARAAYAPRGESVLLRVVGFGHQRSEGIKGGTVVDMDAAERAIRAAVDQAERSAGVTIEDVVLSISCGRLKSDTFAASVATAGEVHSRDVDRVANAGREYAARDGRVVLHCLATGYRLDEDIVISDPRGMIAERLSVDIHAVTADEPALKNLVLCVERCHLSVTRLAAAPYASGLATVAGDEAELGVTCIDMGAGTTTVSVFLDGHFIFSDAIAIGGNHVTMDLARALSTPLEAAERLKTLHGSILATASDERDLVSFPNVGEEAAPQINKVTKAQIAQIIQPRIEDILQLVRDRLAAAGLADAAGGHAVLTGGGSELTGLPDYAAHVLAKAVRTGRPHRLAGLPDQGLGPAFATAVGLLILTQTEAPELVPMTRGPYLATGTGYIARVSQWIKESF